MVNAERILLSGRSRRCFKETEADARHYRFQISQVAAVAAVSRRLRRDRIDHHGDTAVVAAVAAVSRRLRRSFGTVDLWGHTQGRSRRCFKETEAEVHRLRREFGVVPQSPLFQGD